MKTFKLKMIDPRSNLRMDFTVDITKDMNESAPEKIPCFKSLLVNYTVKLHRAFNTFIPKILMKVAHESNMY